MTPITTLIVDDEEIARQKMARYLGQDNRVHVIGEADDGPSALTLIEQHRPQLLMLDIQMPSMTGGEVLRLLPKDYKPAIIFVTAYDNYALKAFEVSAVDYLLKPYGEQRLHEALDKVTQHHDDDDGKIQELLDHIETPEYVRYLPVHHLKRVRLLSVDDISHIVSEHRLVNVYDKSGGRYWTNETL